MRLTPAILTVALATAAPAIAGCGSDDEPSSGGGGAGAGNAQLAIAADPGGAKKFTAAEYTAKAGPVTVDFDNPASIPHSVEIEGNGVEVQTDVVTGGKASVSADLKAGTYEIYCPVGDHRAEGMVAKLTVE